MEHLTFFIIGLAIGIALGTFGALRLLAQRASRNVRQFLAGEGAAITDAQGQPVPAEEFARTLLAPGDEPRSSRTIWIYAVSFVLATAITIAVLLWSRG